MASDIGARIGLQGEAEFERALKNINNSTKELNSELKAVKSGFDKTTSAEEKLSAESGILKNQMDNAQKKVELLKQKLAAQQAEQEKAAQAVAEATEKYGENSKEVQEAQVKYDKLTDAVSATTQDINKAQSEYNKANSELNNLQAAADKAASGQEDLGEEVDDAGDSMDDAKGKTNVFAETLKSQLTAQAIIAGIKAIANAVKEVSDAISEAITGTVTWADDLATLSTTSGISTDSLQKMEYMAGLIDTDVSTITGSMTKMTTKMASGSKSFEDLGVSIRDANGELRDNEDVFYDVIDALGKIDNPTERDAKAMEIFGKSAQDLNPMIEAGADRLKELGDEAVATGYVLGEDAITGLTDVSDAMERMEKAGESAKRNAVAAMAPAILSMTEMAVPAMQTFAQNFGAMFSGEMSVGDFTTYLMEQVSGAVTWINDNLPTIMAMGTEIIVAILNGISEGDIVGEAMSIVSTLIQGIADNFPAIMEAGINLVLNLITGLTNPSSLGNLIQSGINLIMSLVKGLIGAIPQIVAAVPTIISNLVTTIVQNLPLIITSGIELIAALVVGLVQAIPDIVAAIPQIVQAIIQAFKGVDWATIGTNIMEGIKAGLKSMVNALADMARNIGGTILNAAKNALGIHSPSKVFRDEVGKMIPAGLETGIDKAMPSAISDMENQMDNLVIGASATLGGINGIAPVGQSVSNNYGGFVINVNAAEGQSANDIAEQVMYRIQQAVNRREAVFA